MNLLTLESILHFSPACARPEPVRLVHASFYLMGWSPTYWTLGQENLTGHLDADVSDAERGKHRAMPGIRVCCFRIVAVPPVADGVMLGRPLSSVAAQCKMLVMGVHVLYHFTLALLSYVHMSRTAWLSPSLYAGGTTTLCTMCGRHTSIVWSA